MKIQIINYIVRCWTNGDILSYADRSRRYCIAKSFNRVSFTASCRRLKIGNGIYLLKKKATAVATVVACYMLIQHTSWPNGTLSRYRSLVVSSYSFMLAAAGDDNKLLSASSVGFSGTHTGSASHGWTRPRWGTICNLSVFFFCNSVDYFSSQSINIQIRLYVINIFKNCCNYLPR